MIRNFYNWEVMNVLKKKKKVTQPSGTQPDAPVLYT